MVFLKSSLNLGSLSGRGCQEFLTELVVVLTEYPEEESRHDQTHAVYSRMYIGKEVKINETEAGVAACQER